MTPDQTTELTDEQVVAIADAAAKAGAIHVYPSRVDVVLALCRVAGIECRLVADCSPPRILLQPNSERPYRLTPADNGGFVVEQKLEASKPWERRGAWWNDPMNWTRGPVWDGPPPPTNPVTGKELLAARVRQGDEKGGGR